MNSRKVYPESTSRGETRHNQEKITADKNGNTFEPKINIQMGTAGKGSEIRLVGVSNGDDKNARALGASNQTTQQRVVLVNHDVQKESSRAILLEEDCDSDPECKIERKPSKKVSALISKFKNVGASARPPRKDNDPKIPTKKLKTDVNSVLQSRAEALSNKMDTDSEQNEIQRSELVMNVNLGYVQLPKEVSLNFKLHKEGNEGKLNDPLESAQVQASEIQCNTTLGDNSVQNIITDVKSKPVVKPKSHMPITGNTKEKEDQPEAMEDTEDQDSSNTVNYHRPLTKTFSVTGNVSVINSASINKTTKSIYVNKSSNAEVVSKNETCVIKGDINKENSSSLSGRQKAERDEDKRTGVNVTKDGAANKQIFTQDSNAPKIKMPENSRKLPNQHVQSVCDTMSVSAGSDVKCTEFPHSQDRQQPMPLSGTRPANVSEMATSERTDNQSESVLTKTNSEIYSQMDVSVGNDKNKVVSDKQTGQTNTSENAGDVGCSKTEYSRASDRINNALNNLKSELMALKEQDLALLKQLINISHTIQLMQRSHVLRLSKSLSFSSAFLFSTKPLQRRYRPVERQNSAPHTVEGKRMMFSRASTEDDVGGSLSSFEDSEFDSQSELEESTSSLNTIFPNSPKSPRQRQTFQSRGTDVTLSLDVAEDADQTYEDILRRNVKLWKMSHQTQESVIEEVTCLYTPTPSLSHSKKGPFSQKVAHTGRKVIEAEEENSESEV